MYICKCKLYFLFSLVRADQAMVVNARWWTARIARIGHLDALNFRAQNMINYLWLISKPIYVSFLHGQHITLTFLTSGKKAKKTCMKYQLTSKRVRRTTLFCLSAFVFKCCSGGNHLWRQWQWQWINKTSFDCVFCWGEFLCNEWTMVCFFCFV